MMKRIGVQFASARLRFTFALFLLLPLGNLACPGGATVSRNDNARTLENNASSANSSASNASPTAPATISFDGDRAFAHVKKQIDIGPRPAGSAELAKARDYITGELRSYELNTSLDQFTAKTPIGERKMANITAELPGETSDVIIIASHYDTKLFKQFRFVGAVDGGSSTGTVLELARVLAARGQKPHFTYWFVFFDGEEAFCENWEDCGKPNAPDNTYGSRRYIAELIDRNELKRVRALILLDMVGAKDLQFGRDDMSTRWLVDIVWQTARELGYGAQFQDHAEGVGGDDHEPFLRAGIDSLDIIQLNTYPYWHTAQDTLDKVSPRSLKIVGDVVLASLPRIEDRLKSK
jgi:hypothetical protein